MDWNNFFLLSLSLKKNQISLFISRVIVVVSILKKMIMVKSIDRKIVSLPISIIQWESLTSDKWTMARGKRPTTLGQGCPNLPSLFFNLSRPWEWTREREREVQCHVWTSGRFLPRWIRTKRTSCRRYQAKAGHMQVSRDNDVPSVSARDNDNQVFQGRKKIP